MAPDSTVIERLRACCASSRWMALLLIEWPYPNINALTSRSSEILAELEPADLAEAIAAHPRIGDRVAADSTEGLWSRQEQSATAGSSASVREELRLANIAYETRFDQVFLICATGLSTDAMLASLRGRLQNPPERELEIVRAELTKIVELRLKRAFSGQN